MKLPMFKDNNEVISAPQSAKNEYIIKGDKLKKSDGPIGLSCWIYVDNWNYKYGQPKTIISSTNNYFPQISLDPFKNDLNIDVSVFGTTPENDYTDEQLRFELAENLPGQPFPVDTLLDCSLGKIVTVDPIDSTNTTDTGVACPVGTPKDLKIENVNIQKWVNIIVTFNNRTLDVYINGKLVKSKPFNNVIINGGEYPHDVLITPDGGFGGFISKVQYYPFFITPAKAWSIYKGGFGDAFASALNKYNLAVSFYEDQVEKKKYYVF
tara:strand:- start:191 stop:988 length:798 start_codon:yes stop_codon:yes gene_type:complete